MRVRELMTEYPAACTAEDPCAIAGDIMARRNCGFVPVVDSLVTKRVVGVVTDRDLALHLTQADRRPHEISVEECMTSQPKTVRPEMDVDEAIRLMEEEALHRVPVVENGKLVGVLSRKDLVGVAHEERDRPRPLRKAAALLLACLGVAVGTAWAAADGPKDLLKEARTSLADKEYERALSTTDQTLLVEPASAKAAALRRKVIHRWHRSLLVDAQRALKRKEYAAAETALEKAIELNPVSKKGYALKRKLARLQERDAAVRERDDEVLPRAFANEPPPPEFRPDPESPPLPAVAGPAAESAETPAWGGEYKIRPDDLLQVTVFEEPDLSTQVRVSSNGEISFPLLGQVRAAGMTASGLERELAGRLAEGFLINPQVQVFLQTQQHVSVTGEVKRPGTYPLPTERPMTVMEAISAAGGFTDEAQINGTRIIRQASEGGEKKTIPIRVTSITRQGDKSEDVPIEPNDIVYVPESFF